MPPSILIVDDDPVQRRLLSAAVDRFGYAATAVESGAEALARLTAPDGEAFALVILDLVMPDVDGMAGVELRSIARALIQYGTPENG